MQRIECSSSFNTSILMKLNQNGEKDQKSALICAKLNLGSYGRCLWSRSVNGHCLFFSISSGKPDIVKVLHKKWIWHKLEAMWLFRAQAILRVQVEIIDEEISWWKLTSPLNIVCRYLPISYVKTIFNNWFGEVGRSGLRLSNLIVFQVKLMFES